MTGHRSGSARTSALRALPALVGVGLLLGCAAPGTADDAGGRPHEPAPERTAERVLQVTSVHESTGMTLLEGPTFGPDGNLYVVDVTAPAGEPKVLRVDVAERAVTPVLTDDDSAYTSAQFSPHDGRLYLTDFVSGGIDTVTADGEDPRTFFSGDVDGLPMRPDDVAFDESGNLYVTDTTGYADPSWEPKGRIVRIDRETAEPTVLARDLPAPNGISFSPDFASLWVSHNTGNRVDYLGLDDDGTEVTTAYPAIYFSGGKSQVDSTAVDAAGNLYQGVHGQAKVFVYSPTGELLTTVSLPHRTKGLTSATNVAIRPGTTDAFMTVSGSAGGFVYEFDALATGIRQSNGG
ncbi:lactonase [Promicromonospora umidemergens]|uniref:SMP-30/gluconolactonase/LRE family protein n=1 Tax=Promicromonospora umidemergens TaxID=629679 RepID=A0ABP8XLX9_9MICO|nr:SMP-30/gluconolactonase/LRE family protein [Promicromonospora umidemergens]MCP2282068.1 lactonase [Promicromonospora umidemergens]